jgi:hypothetical protein
MKKQLLIAAVAATFTSVAMADIAISGAVKMNSKDGVYNHEADLFITGKSGDTSVSAGLAMDGNAIAIENMYMKTTVAGVSVKMGQWKSGKNELNITDAASERVNVSTSFGGLSLAYEDTGSGNSTTIGGSLAGVKVSHKVKSSDATETKASGSIGGVAVKVHSKESSTGNTDTSTTLTTEVQGVSLTYSRIDSDTTTETDGYIGKGTVANAEAIGIKTSIAGNTVQFKSITMGTTDSNKVIVTRKLGAGATFEATYNDSDVDTEDFLDLELAVKF